MLSNRSVLFYAALAVITLFSLHMNLSAVNGTVIDGLIRGDSREYLAYAYNLKVHSIYSSTYPLSLDTHPIPDARRTPGYAFFVMFFLNLSKNDWGLTTILYLQAILGAGVTLLTTLTFKRALPGWCSIVCGLLVAISPHLINSSVYILTESLFTFLLVLQIYLLIVAQEKRNHYLFVLSGLVFGLTWLVRPTTMLLSLVYIIFFAFNVKNKKSTWKELALFILPFVIVFSAWTVRNIEAIGKTSDPQLAINFIHHGSYINFMYKDNPESYGYPYRFDPQKVTSMGDALNMVKTHFEAEPVRYISWILLGKPTQFLSWNLTESIGDAFIYAPLKTPYQSAPLFTTTHTIAKALHMPLMLLAIAGSLYFLFVYKTTNATIKICSILLLYFIVFHMIGAPFPRYSIPVRPFCYGLALCFLYKLYPLILKKDANRNDHPMPE